MACEIGSNYLVITWNFQIVNIRTTYAYLFDGFSSSSRVCAKETGAFYFTQARAENMFIKSRNKQMIQGNL